MGESVPTQTSRYLNLKGFKMAMDKSSEVTITIPFLQELALIKRYGRKASLETLVRRAIAEALTLKTPWQKPEPKKREKPPVVINATPGIVDPERDFSS